MDPLAHQKQVENMKKAIALVTSALIILADKSKTFEKVSVDDALKALTVTFKRVNFKKLFGMTLEFQQRVPSGMDMVSNENLEHFYYVLFGNSGNGIDPIRLSAWSHIENTKIVICYHLNSETTWSV